MHCSRRLIVQTLVLSCSYLHRQMSPPETLVVEGGTTWARNGRWILPENTRLPRNIQGSFTCRKSTTWAKRLSFPYEGRRSEDFFSPWKIRRLRPGLNPRTWVPKDSTLPLDHRYYRMFLLSLPCFRQMCRIGSLYPPAYPVTNAVLRGTMKETLFINLNALLNETEQRPNIPDLLAVRHFVTGF